MNKQRNTVNRPPLLLDYRILTIIGIFALSLEGWAVYKLLAQPSGSLWIFGCITALIIWMSVLSYHDLTALEIPSPLLITGAGVLALVYLSLSIMHLFRPEFESGLPFSPINTMFSNPFQHLIVGVAASTVAGAFLIATKRKGLGTADIYGFGIMGLLTGYPVIINALYVSVFSALGYGIFVALMKRKFRGVRIPFIPFLSLGTLAALLLGGGSFVAGLL